MDPMTMSIIASTGLQLGSQILGQRAEERERERAQRMARRRRRFMGPAVEMWDQYQQTLEDLPGKMRRSRESGIASLAQKRYQRLRENLGRAGITGGSSLAGEEGMKSALGFEQARRGAMANEAQTLQSMRSRGVGLRSQLANAMYPSAGQTGARAMQESYIDYTQPISTALALSQMASPDYSSGYGGIRSIKTGPDLSIDEIRNFVGY